MVVTISWTTVFIVFISFVFFAVWQVESKLREAVHDLRMEHREKIAELRTENRELRYKLTRLQGELASVERRIN